MIQSFKRAALTGLSVMVLAGAAGCAKNERPDENIDYGTVVKVENCSYPARCDIQTDKVTLTGVNIIDFPGHYVGTGDKIGYERSTKDGTETRFYKKNAEKKSNGSCSTRVSICQNQLTPPKVK
jgi:hypothetical protein